MNRDRELRRRTLALRCSGCAYRKGTPANRDQAAMGAALKGASFFCHKWIDARSDEAALLADPDILSQGGLCAGHVAYALSDEDIARWLDGHGDGSAWVEADFYCAWSYNEPCRHLHRRALDAWFCAIHDSDPHAEVRYFDSWPLLEVAAGPMEDPEGLHVTADGRRYEWARGSVLNERQQAELQAQIEAELGRIDLDEAIGCR